MKSMRRFFTPSLRRRINIAFLVVTAIVVIVVVATYLQLQPVKPYSDAIIRDSQELVAYQDLAQALASVDANLERYLVIRGVEYQEAVETNLLEMEAALTFLQTGADPTEENPLLLEELDATIMQLQSDVRQVLALQPDASSREINQYIVVVYDEIETAKQLQEELTGLTLYELESAAQAQSLIAENVVNHTVIPGIIVVVITVVTTIFVDRRLRAIGALTQTTTAIAEGDLSRVAPVESEDEIGVLAVSFNTMTSQLRSTLENLEQQVADRTRALETSTEVSRRLSTILDQSQLVREVVEQLRFTLGYYHAHIYLYDESKQNLLMAGGTGEAGRTMLARGHKIEKGRGLVGQAAESNQAVLIPDVTQAEGWLPNPLLPDTKAEVAVPISIGDEVIGVLDVQHNITHGLSNEDTDLIQSIANQVAVALLNAKAYEQAQEQAIREAQVSIISQRIQAATSIEDVLRIAVSELGQTLEAERADIELSMVKKSNGGSSAS